MGGASKSNEGQAALVAKIVELLRTPLQREDEDSTRKPPDLSIAALTPYSKQVKALQSAISSTHNVSSHTIDSFQGRESDIIVFSTVRCNVSNDIGFVEDARRLNVAWTRAKLALILVGDRATMTASSALWSRAIGACTEVAIAMPALD
jgi:superfamily I DNA and/or RNA helicase